MLYNDRALNGSPVVFVVLSGGAAVFMEDQAQFAEADHSR